MQRNWTKQEEQYLIDNYDHITVNEAATKLNRSRTSIMHKARKLGLSNGFYWNEAGIKYIIDNYGILSIKQIAINLNRKPREIRFKLKKLGLYRKEKVKWTKEEDLYLQSNFATVLPKDAEEKLGRTWFAICGRGRALGLKRDENVVKKMHSVSAIGHGKLYSVNSAYFDVLNIHNAYVLGFLATDGCVGKRKNRDYYTVGLGIKDNDRYVLENISKDMESTYPIYMNKRDEITTMVSFCIRDQHLCRRVMELGIIPKKSLVLKCPVLPVELVPHFIRGVIDGDGCVTKQESKPRVSIVSASKDFIYGLKDMLNILGVEAIISCHLPQPNDKLAKNPMYDLRVRGIYNVIKLYDLMYTDDVTLFLTRKRERLEWIVNKYRNTKYNRQPA
jgi:hypothetical protein